MKIRTGFVSNSSSSSFIVIGSYPTNKDYDYAKETILEATGCAIWDELTLPNRDLGETEYGWQTTVYDGFGDRLNFCAIQIISLRKDLKYIDEDKSEGKDTSYWESRIYKEKTPDELEEMLKKVIKEHTGYDIVIVDGEGFNYSYIDHQSCATEGMNMEMFEDESKLESFIFGHGSCINNDNDNY